MIRKRGAITAPRLSGGREFMRVSAALKKNRANSVLTKPERVRIMKRKDDEGNKTRIARA